MDKKSIIQWNCRGLKANYNEILILTTLLSPTVFCLQETFLKNTDNINFNQSAKGTEMTDSIRNSSKKKKKKKKKKNLNFYKTFTRRTHNGICIKPLQEEHITGLSERLTKR